MGLAIPDGFDNYMGHLIGLLMVRCEGEELFFLPVKRLLIVSLVRKRGSTGVLKLIPKDYVGGGVNVTRLMLGTVGILSNFISFLSYSDTYFLTNFILPFMNFLASSIWYLVCRFVCCSIILVGNVVTKQISPQISRLGVLFFGGESDDIV